MSSTYELPPVDDDGLPAPEVGEWAEDKYRRVHLYAKLFTRSMRGKWDRLVYLDLFAGAGRSRVRQTSRLLPGSPTLALTLDPPFDRYVFCEQAPDLLDALAERVSRDFPARSVTIVPGDVNERVEALVRALPSPGERALTFCFVDPYSFKNLDFSTLRTLATRPRPPIDFLVLIPTGYDATRNQWIYTEPDRTRVLDRFLGKSDFRERWPAAQARGIPFERFVTDAFGAAMQRLDYIYDGTRETDVIKMPVKNVPLYRLALFSRHRLGAKFWREVKKYAPDQRSLF
jgi:three-Cys-motif partner protein